MNKIKCQKLTAEIRKSHNIEQDFLEDRYSNVDFVTIHNDADVELGYAVVTPKGDFNLEKEFEEYYDWLLQDEYPSDLKEYNNLYAKYKDTISKSVLLNSIEVVDKNKGTGTMLLNYLQRQYKDIFLYALIEAEEFYERNGFQELSSGDHVYIYLDAENKCIDKAIA